VLVGARDGEANFRALKAIGADFAYLEASSGATGRDAAFAANLAKVRESGLPFGVVHAYDPCVAAERQAANFVTIVPRDDTLLPPAIALERPATECGDPVSEAGVESELTTFLNEIEGHVGKPAVLKLAPAFEERYHLAARIERNLWLERDWLQPAYAGRPWTLWTANSSLSTAASDEPVRWVVLQP
jgi:lysozyme